MGRLPYAERAAARAALVLAALGVAGVIVHDVAGVGSDALWQDWVYETANALSAAVAIHRGLRGPRPGAPWLLLGAAMALWTAGDVYYTVALEHLDDVPTPSLADAGYLAFYPLAYAAVVLLVRRRTGAVRTSVWLDGLIGALASAAVAAAVVVQAVSGSLGGDLGANVTNMAYPVGDLLLLCLLVAGCAMTGWKPGRAWLLLAVGLALWVVFDSIYLCMTAAGTYNGGLADVGWPLGMVVIAAAAWVPEPRAASTGERAGWAVIGAPAAFALVALGVLVYDHAVRVNLAAVALSTGALVVALVRLGMTFAENLRMLAQVRDESLTDALTGLGNRRSLNLRLEAALADGRPHLLALLDLNGFKAYNDTFGHPAGDALLTQLGHRLAAALPPGGAAFRMGGDEFCVLAPGGDEDLDAVIAAAHDALTARGEAFDIVPAWGHALLPREGDTPSEALRTADRRMYVRKRDGRPTAERQSTDVLRRVLQERHPKLERHLLDVSELARAVAERLGVEGEELEHVVYAAELHDVGKIAIPDEILDKPGPLDEDEWRLMRRHTVIGERIVAAAPALERTARLVRSSHERWDGRGYPDGLAGEEIPLAARIVCACDAFEAMTGDRPYRPAKTVDEAVVELRGCAGTQFDPRVVDALVACLRERQAAGVIALAPASAKRAGGA